MAGSHVFVTMGDVTNIACDAWLLPSDRHSKVRPHWLRDVPGLDTALPAHHCPEFDDGRVLVNPLTGWPVEEPMPIPTAGPFQATEQVEDFRPALRSFIAAGARHARIRRKERDSRAAASDAGRHGSADAPRLAAARPNPLLAMPLFGTGGGGAGAARGDAMRQLLEQARESAAEHGVDVVLVLKDEKDFAMAEAIRRRTAGWWDELEEDLRRRAVELADIAHAGQLVPFMGGGVSISAGGPSWKQLLRRLAVRAGLEPEARDRLALKNPLDQASILRRIFEDSGLEDFNTAIARELDLPRYGLAPALLATLPTTQSITLNYDSLFEMAADDAGLPRTVIPEEATSRSARWLLKLHGSVTRPESIVLTRDDYLGYNSRRDALSALVKATFITQHLLFVGFGLADDHFHEIVHAVQQALPRDEQSHPELATALTLFVDPLDRRAWENRLELVPMSRGEERDVPEAARTLEIFLDMLLAHATDSHSYLLADGYYEALTEDEKSLRAKLLSLAGNLGDGEWGSSGGRLLAQMLATFGLPEESARRL